MTQLETAMAILIKTFDTYAASEGSKDSLSKTEVKTLLEKELPELLKVPYSSWGGKTVQTGGGNNSETCFMRLRHICSCFQYLFTKLNICCVVWAQRCKVHQGSGRKEKAFYVIHHNDDWSNYIYLLCVFTSNFQYLNWPRNVCGVQLRWLLCSYTYGCEL